MIHGKKACSCRSGSPMKTIEIPQRDEQNFQKIRNILSKIHQKWWYDKYLLKFCAIKCKCHAQWAIFRKILKMQIFRYFRLVTTVGPSKFQKFQHNQSFWSQISWNRHQHYHNSPIFQKVVPVTCPRGAWSKFFCKIWIPWPQITLDWNCREKTLNLN